MSDPNNAVQPDPIEPSPPEPALTVPAAEVRRTWPPADEVEMPPLPAPAAQERPTPAAESVAAVADDGWDADPDDAVQSLPHCSQRRTNQFECTRRRVA